MIASPDVSPRPRVSIFCHVNGRSGTISPRPTAGSGRSLRTIRRPAARSLPNQGTARLEAGAGVATVATG